MGHYLGHYLSAMAMAYEGSSRLNQTLKRRGDEVVAILASVQEAHGKNGQQGLIYPFDVRSFQNLYDKAPEGAGGDDGGTCVHVCTARAVLVFVRKAGWFVRPAEWRPPDLANNAVSAWC